MTDGAAERLAAPLTSGSPRVRFLPPAGAGMMRGCEVQVFN